MEDAQMKIYDLNRQETGEEALPGEVFGARVNRTLIHEAVRHYLAAGRAGTHDTKDRSEVAGSGRKLWRQKKTGRARIGSIRSPLWRTGGIVHGPTPRSYDYHFPGKKRAGAIRSALSEKVRSGRVLVVKDLDLPSHKTGEFAKALRTLGVEGGALILDEPIGRNLDLAARNLPRCKVSRSSNVNVVDILKYEYLVMTTAAVRKAGEVFAP
jgi:large subunit ribosomal protein L4